MRSLASIFVVLSFVLLGSAVAMGAPPERGPERSIDLARARALDKEGAKAYGEGRYADAIRAFDESYRLGGPSFELWNVAKCLFRLGQYEQSGETLERYLATPNLPKADREEATRQLEELKKRPSTLSVTSRTNGLEVLVDGEPAPGKTPLTMVISPGSHTITVRSARPYTSTIEARYGNPVSVDAAPWEPASAVEAPKAKRADAEESQRIAIRGALGISLPRFGGVGGDVGPLFLASGTYRVAYVGPVTLAVGGLVSIAGDSWGNRTGEPNQTPACGAIRDAQGATAIALYGHGTATFSPAERVRIVGLGGVGLAGYVVGNLGGDLFVPSCDPSPGIRPTLLLGARLDIVLTQLARLSILPVSFQVQPGFDGARAAPRDASGIWMRFGVAIGAGVDL